MRIEELLIGFAIGILTSLLVFFTLYKYFSPPQIYVVDFSYLQQKGITKTQVERLLQKNVILIDRRCVLNPYGKDITFQIEKTLRH